MVETTENLRDQPKTETTTKLNNFFTALFEHESEYWTDIDWCVVYAMLSFGFSLSVVLYRFGLHDLRILSAIQTQLLRYAEFMLFDFFSLFFVSSITSWYETRKNIQTPKIRNNKWKQSKKICWKWYIDKSTKECFFWVKKWNKSRVFMVGKFKSNYKFKPITRISACATIGNNTTCSAHGILHVPFSFRFQIVVVLFIICTACAHQTAIKKKIYTMNTPNDEPVLQYSSIHSDGISTFF